MDKELNQQFKQLLESTVIQEGKANSPESDQQLLALRNFIKGKMPNQLFRFRSANLYNVLSFEHNTMMLCSPEMFSDCFDSVVYVDKEMIYNEIERSSNWDFLKQVVAEIRKTGFLPEYIRSFYGDANARRLEELYVAESDENIKTAIDEWRECFLKSMLEDISPIASELVNSIRKSKETKIACFTEDIRSSYMWDKYAGGYTGFALEYDMTGELFGKDEEYPKDQVYPALYPVIYSASRYDATGITIWKLMNALCVAQGLYSPPCPDLLFNHKAFLYKDAIGYSHEREWRLMCVCEKFKDSKYLEIETGDRMKAIYYGPYIATNIKEHLSTWAKRHKIKEYFVKLDETNKNFELTIEPI